MYRCGICDAVSKPGQPLRRHVVQREVPSVKHVGGKTVPAMRLEIEVEIPVCLRCASALELGASLDQLRQKRREERNGQPLPPGPTPAQVPARPAVVVAATEEPALTDGPVVLGHSIKIGNKARVRKARRE